MMNRAGEQRAHGLVACKKAMMAMLLGPSARVLALLLMATATGAAETKAATKEYGSACSSSLECGSSAPFCQIYLTDRSMLIAQSKKQKKSSADDYLNVKPTAHGFCTECKSDCDCGVGEFCAVDTEGEGISVGKHAKLSAENTPAAASELKQDHKDEFEAVSKAFEGMKLRSKCMKMKITKTSEQLTARKGMEECMPSLSGEEFATQVDYKEKTSSTTAVITRASLKPSFWYTGAPAAVAQFCGHIYEHALNNKKAFYERIDDPAVKGNFTEDDKKLLKPTFMDPIVCTKVSLFKGEAIKQCSRDRFEYSSVYSVSGSRMFKYDFNSPAIAWTGSCAQGECQICKEGESRCDSTSSGIHGIHQECSHGEWKESAGTVLLRGKGEKLLEPFVVTVLVATALLIIIQCTQGGLLFKISKNEKKVNNDSRLHSDTMADTRAAAREVEMRTAVNAGFGSHPSDPPGA